MMIELYRIKNNHIGLFSVMVCILMGILGLILLVSLDGYKLDEISIGLLQYSYLYGFIPNLVFLFCRYYLFILSQ